MTNEASQDELFALAVKWIKENSANARSADTVISPSTQLLKEGVLDSLGFVDLLAFLESTTGNEIDLLELSEEELTTLAALCPAALRPSLSSEDAHA